MAIRKGQSETHTTSAGDLRRAWSDSTWLLGAIAVGTVLRCGSLSLVAIEHFDEAVYASNVLFGPETRYQYPGREFYAPPLMPALIEWTEIAWSIVGAPRPVWLPMVPSLVFGVGLIPSVWWTVRRWFGKTAANAGAWLVALSSFHAFYSRTALTDVALLFWMLWSVHWSWKALQDCSTRSAVWAGLFSALAWWTKYNGWLTLAIALSGGIAEQLLRSRADRNWTGFAKVVTLMGVTAGALWMPVLWDCQDVGGYAAVAANHRGYVAGWTSWWANFLRHNAVGAWYREGLSQLVLLVAAVVSVMPQMFRTTDDSSGSPPRSWSRMRLLQAGCAALGLGGLAVFAPLLTLAILGLVAVAKAFSDWMRARALSAGEHVAGCLIAAWFAGLMLVTPLYTPYPRLALPLWLAGSLAACWLIHQLSGGTPADKSDNVTAPRDSGDHPARRRRWMEILGAVGALAILGVQAAAVWEDRRSHQVAAKRLIAAIEQSGGDRAQSVILVYGSPPLFYALARHGYTALPRADLRLDGIPSGTRAFLVTGLGVEQQAEYQRDWPRAAGRCEQLLEQHFAPSSLVQFDSYEPWSEQARRGGDVRLYRLN